MTTEIWRADLDRALQALHAVQRVTEQHTAEGSGPAADPLMAALCALEASRTARTHVNNLIAALTEHALGQGANWQVLGYRFDAYDE